MRYLRILHAKIATCTIFLALEFAHFMTSITYTVDSQLNIYIYVVKWWEEKKHSCTNTNKQICTNTKTKNQLTQQLRHTKINSWIYGSLIVITYFVVPIPLVLHPPLLSLSAINLWVEKLLPNDCQWKQEKKKTPKMMRKRMCVMGRNVHHLKWSHQIECDIWMHLIDANDLFRFHRIPNYMAVLELLAKMDAFKSAKWESRYIPVANMCGYYYVHEGCKQCYFCG